MFLPCKEASGMSMSCGNSPEALETQGGFYATCWCAFTDDGALRYAGEKVLPN